MENSNRFETERATANLTGLPITWLRREAKAGRIPHAVVGHRRMYVPALVLAAVASFHAAKKGGVHAL